MIGRIRKKSLMFGRKHKNSSVQKDKIRIQMFGRIR